MGKGKIMDLFKEVVELINDGDIFIVGGFGFCGIFEQLIFVIRDWGIKNLIVVSNNCGVDDWGLGFLFVNCQIKKMIVFYVGENKIFEW